MMRVLMITSEWPSRQHPNAAPFVQRQAAYLRKAGVEVDVFAFRGSRRPSNYLRAWLGLRQQHSPDVYDLVHAQWGQSAAPALPKSRPLVVTFRGSDVLGIVDENGAYSSSGKLLTFFSRIVARVADQIILVSAQMAEHLPQRPYHVIPSGLDLDLFVPLEKKLARERLGLPLDQKIIFFGGNPAVKRKRFALAESAVALLQDGRQAIEIIVARNIEHEQMPLYYGAADALILTSLHEGSPNVIKEALACNLPVVAADVGDVRSRIGRIEGCIVCDDDQPATFAQALRHVLERNSRINGRETVLDLDETLLTQKVIAVYEKALEGLSGKRNA